LRVRRPESEYNHLTPTNAEVKNAWICIPAPSIRLHGVMFS
jgi:hypothetical protein